ncbi:TIGR00366 family protein [Citricoccus sp. NR2]|uniref:TIGR00366 family protein n=1 Tax=Citricoccus sp. NR2 TaxID=3004095 RepID=UPI0022DE4992|nr:TIGR00366 family protein [Citricoccus sp. NR2]WBL19486.1 TIGR00366 family protein [Citricoccus sp. NR2]
MNVKGLHYPLAIAAGYAGFIIYGTGLSGTIPLTIATEGHFLEEQMGTIPMSETVFSPIVLITTAVIFLTLPFFNAMLHPKDPAKVKELDRSTVKAPAAAAPQDVALTKRTFAATMNTTPWVGIVIGLLAMLFIVRHFFVHGGDVNLNTVNFLFLFLGLMLFARPSKFLEAVSDGVKIVSGIIIQYPFYAGIMGILVGSGLVVSFANWFGSFSTDSSLPFFSFLSAGLINLLAPSGGGQWAVQGPVMIEAAQALGASEGATAMAVAFGDQWTNMVQPFWVLPVLAISGLKLRDVMGYLVLVLLLTGAIFAVSVLVWGFLL